jgi:hypothetical protein
VDEIRDGWFSGDCADMPEPADLLAAMAEIQHDLDGR